MNRLILLATVVLLGLPSIAPGQQASLDDLLRVEAKVSERSAGPTFDQTQLWSAYNRAGWRAINKGYFDVAEKEFAAAIGVARKLVALEKDHRLLARSYADYAYAIQRQGRHAEAEPLMKWVLVAREAELEADSPAIAQTLNQLSTIYYEVGRFAEAEPLLKRAIETQAKAAKPSPVEHARSHTLLGLLMVTQHRYDEAETPFRKALAIREKSRGASHVETGDAASNLAWVYLTRGKHEQARPLFERSLRIFEQTRGSIDPSVAHTLHGLAKIQSNKGEQEAAEEKFLKAIAIWDAKPDPDTRALAEVLKDYADFLETLGRAEDLSKIKARLSPLRARMSANETKLKLWYRWPGSDLDPGSQMTVPRRRS